MESEPLVKLEQDADFVNLQMTNFTEHFSSGEVWYSPPFYFKDGYKICVVVYPKGVGYGKGTHVSLFLKLLKGERDDELKWPYHISANMALHLPSCTTSFSSAVRWYPRPTESSEGEWVLCKNEEFAKLEDVLEHLLVDDCFTVKVTVVTGQLYATVDHNKRH